jgi:hypothetical protein
MPLHNIVICILRINANGYNGETIENCMFQLVAFFTLFLTNHMLNTISVYFIARRLGASRAYLAFVPFANVWLWHSLAKKPLLLLIIQVILPVIAIILIPILTTWQNAAVAILSYSVLFFAALYIEYSWSGSISSRLGLGRTFGYIRALAKNLSILFFLITLLLVIGSVIGEFQENYSAEELYRIERIRDAAKIFFYGFALLYLLNIAMLGLIAWMPTKHK